MSESVSLVILCGGFGTRIAHVENGPKCLIEINNKPFISYVIDSVPRKLINRIILCTGHQGNKFEILKEARGDIEILLSHEDSPLGTGGAALNVNPELLSNNVLLMNGDSLCTFDFVEMYQKHIHSDADMSILVVKDEVRKDAGYIRLDSLGVITNFSEKKELSHSGYVNAGIYIIKKNVLLKENYKKLQNLSLEGQLIPKWVKKYKVMGCITERPLIDIGTPERLAEAKLTFHAI